MRDETEAYYADRLGKEQWERMKELMKLLPRTDQPPDDPRTRSLWSREHRSTGPDKDQYEHRGQR